MSRLKLFLTIAIVLTFATLKFVPKNDVDSLVAATSSTGLTSALGNTESYTAVKDNAPIPRIYAGSYLLIDTKTNEILISKNPHTRIPIASTTKMMTALVVMDEMKLDTVATIVRPATIVNGSKINLQTNEKITIGNLLKGMLIYSGNDAAYSLAYAFTNDPTNFEPFVEKMNAKAAAFHLQDTHYQDPAGLDDTGYSTPFDLSQIARHLLENKTLAGIVSTPQASITSTDGAIVHDFKNSNRLILPDSPYYRSDVIGVKTGFTPTAGHCLVAAYNFKDRVLIGVVMNTNESLITASAAEMSKMFAWADNNITVSRY